MKKEKVNDLVNLSRAELLEKEKGLKEELFKLNLGRYSGRVEKPHMFSLIKRGIARIETILHAKEGKK
jgi:large subunit ribosomal protein L29